MPELGRRCKLSPWHEHLNPTFRTFYWATLLSAFKAEAAGLVRAAHEPRVGRATCSSLNYLDKRVWRPI
jgi:hypothetical protein